MGANAQTSVPAFTAGQVLTAQQQTEINTGIPVFATTTTRDAAFGGTGEKTLAEGQFAYIEASNTTQYYDGTAWQTVGGGLTYITGASFSAVSTVSMPAGTFTSTYQNYKVLFVATGSTVLNVSYRFNYSGTPATTNYYGGAYGASSAFSGVREQANATSLFLVGIHTATYNMLHSDITVYDPSDTAKFGSVSGTSQGSYAAGEQFAGWIFGGQRQTSGAIDGLTFITSTGTITGTYKVYGLANS